MSDPQVPEVVSDWASGLDNLLLRTVLGKAGADAISAFIGAAADIPVQSLKWVSTRIADDAAARSQVTAARAGAVAEAVTAHPDVLERGLRRWAGLQAKKQANIEGVAREAVEDLRAKPAAPDTPPPDPDFMAKFSRAAEDASSDDLRQLFGRVLAGEIRQPGSASLATLHVLNIMDKELAEHIQRVRPWISENNTLPVADPLTGGKDFFSISRLADHGMIRLAALQRSFPFDAQGRAGITFGTRVLVFAKNNVTAAFDFRTQIWAVTPVGEQIFALVDRPGDTESLIPIANAWKLALGAVRVTIADLIGEGETQIRVLNERQFP